MTTVDTTNISPRKNVEKYLEVLDDAGEVVEDAPFMDRPYWSCKLKECPFPGCSANAWARTSRFLWSVKDAESVGAYLKFHGMESTLHGRNSDNPLYESTVDSLISEVNIDETVDTYEHRQSYRRMDNKKRKADAKWDSSSWNEWHAHDGSHGSQSWDQGSQQAWAADSATQQLSADVKALESTVRTLAQQTFSSMPQTPSSSAFGDMTAALTDGWDSGLQLSQVQEKTVTLSYSQLLLMKESVTRAKEGAKQAMASLMTPLNQLRTEVGVLANSETVLSELIDKAKA